jgi:hypothetical protein
MIPNTDDLLEGSEPLSGNAALPPAGVATSSIRTNLFCYLCLSVRLWPVHVVPTAHRT